MNMQRPAMNRQTFPNNSTMILYEFQVPCERAIDEDIVGFR